MEEQRSQPGCPAREVVLDQRGQATDMERPCQISFLLSDVVYVSVTGRSVALGLAIFHLESRDHHQGTALVRGIDVPMLQVDECRFAGSEKDEAGRLGRGIPQ